MKKIVNVKPMRPGGYYPSQLGLDDEYRSFRLAAVNLLDDMGKVLVESLRKHIARMPEADRGISFKLFSVQYDSLVRRISQQAALLEEFKPEDMRSDLFQELRDLISTYAIFLCIIEGLDENV